MKTRFPQRLLHISRSLTFRLTVSYAIALLIVIALTAAATFWALSYESRRMALTFADAQAREVAQLMQARESAGIWDSTDALDALVQWKISEIRQQNDADVWLVNARGVVFVLNSTEVDAQLFEDTANRAALNTLLSGKELSGENLFPQLGHNVTTVGVPWRNRQGAVAGAVLLHIAVKVGGVGVPIAQSAAIVCVITLLACFALFALTQRMTKPLSDVVATVGEYAHGDLSRRVLHAGEDEIGQLGATINTMVEEIDRLETARRDFVSNVSHELRSPMTSIAGYVSGMLDGTIPETQRGTYLTIVKDETARLNQLIAELLDVSRIESGFFSITQSTFDINEIIRRALIHYEERISARGIDVEVVFRQDPCMVRADRDRLSQVMINLIDNAVKFMQSGGRLRVWTHESLFACHIAVEDTGSGIAPEDLPHIFDRFYTAEKAHSPGHGTGLGLYIVKRILLEHGQDVRVTTTLGKGSTFAFELPLATDA